jgi:predicted CopG family antitoxin
MAKNISVSDDVYEYLSKIKRKNESFSDVIRRLATKFNNISEIAGNMTFSKEEYSKVERAFEKQKKLDEIKKHELLRKVE